MADAWEEALKEHQRDKWAHPIARHEERDHWAPRFLNLDGDIADMQTRLGRLEKLQQQIIGGLAVISILVAGGVVTIVLAKVLG